MKAMTDIETLSSRNDAAVIAIGFCVFDKVQILDKIELLIDPQLAIGHRDPRTIQWWEEQDEHVRMKMFSGMISPWEACQQLVDFFDVYNKCKEVWANPPQFDHVILRHLFDECGVKCPWHYRVERDFRTLKAIAHQHSIDYQRAYEGIDKHDALSDAMAQAHAVMIIEKELGL